MFLLSLLLILAIWGYVGWEIKVGVGEWWTRMKQRRELYSPRPREKPQDASEPKRRAIYRPPNKER